MEIVFERTGRAGAFANRKIMPATTTAFGNWSWNWYRKQSAKGMNEMVRVMHTKVVKIRKTHKDASTLLCPALNLAFIWVQLECACGLFDASNIFLSTLDGTISIYGVWIVHAYAKPKKRAMHVIVLCCVRVCVCVLWIKWTSGRWMAMWLEMREPRESKVWKRQSYSSKAREKERGNRKVSWKNLVQMLCSILGDEKSTFAFLSRFWRFLHLRVSNFIGFLRLFRRFLQLLRLGWNYSHWNYIRHYEHVC